MKSRNFGFSSKEKTGIVVISVFILTIIVAIRIMPRSQNDNSIFADSASVNWISLANDSTADEELPWVSTNRPTGTLYFNFDPNTLDSAGFWALGFTKKQTSAIIKYRYNFGPFKSAEDFSKVYVVSEEKFQKLEPYIVIDQNKIRIELNSATTDQLETFKGIGSKLAQRIIAYRTKIGGFNSVDQLSEVYGLKPEVIKEISPNLSVNANLISPININKASQMEMQNHPYFDFATIAIIIKKRDKNPIKNISELSDQLDKNVIEKIEPYICYE